ncbi:DNA polymerase III subunit gamma/tau [Aquincola tertiaricarbonis]|uniref:DNA polymerase III subunit gamma/tau n=1 Tax=Aquincola tertiaricarbonis TaxID=391953 RepID=A0ABY4SCS2_AQUTE|nr:DNA polymerase III subunit gamma/tau [Aquincola tertiaricarbonis]URI08841.1 DNA polymerase III subunit gamma/tau [Aquincola tertiaricarbonis]
MSYVVLARKYRPRSFEQMVGQEHVVRALTNALDQQRLHHAYLFTGTRGIGKTTVSRILAKSLNCIGPDGSGGITAHPCGVCSACTEIDADRYVDYIEMDAASNRGIDEIRDLLERAAYKPSVGRFKVFMIDEAHQLTKESFNALLKTLEEPPDYLKFVLATTDPEKMLPTVLSRCLQFNLRPMAPEVVYEHLQHVLQAEAVDHDEASVRLLSRAARGSMRDALSLTDQAIAYGAGRIEAEGVRQMLGAVDRSHAAGFVEALARRDGPALLAGVKALRDRGLSPAGTLEEMTVLLQQMAVEQAVPGSLDDTDPDTPATRELAGLLPPDETQLLYSLALHGRTELQLAPDEYAALTMVLLRLFAFPPAGPGGGQARAGGGARTAAAAHAATPASAAPNAPVPAPAAPTSTAPAPAALRAPAPQAVARAEVPAKRPAAAVAATDATRVSEPSATPYAATGAAPAARQAAAPAPQAAPPQRPAMRAPAPLPTRPAPAAAATPERQGASRSSMPEPPAWLDEAPPDLERESPSASADFDAADADVMALPAVARAAAPAAPPARPVAAPLVLNKTALGERWATVVAGLNQKQAVVAMVRELAMQAELIAIDESADKPVWTLRVERESLRTPTLVNKLQAVLADVAGLAVQLLTEAGVPQDSPSLRDRAERERRQREAEQIILNDPVVLGLMSRFPTARVVPGSIKPQ